MLPDLRTPRPELTGPPPPAGVLGLPERYNAVADLLDDPIARGQRAGPALVPAEAPDRPMSYEDLAERVARVAAALAGLGVDAEQRVALVADDRPEWVVAFLGVVRAGRVALPLSTLLRRDQLAPMLAAARPRLLLTDPERVDELGDLAPEVVTLDEFAAAVAAANPSPPAPTFADEPALILFTSGTTGAPKGAIHAHRDLAVARCFAAVMGYSAQDRLWSTSKLFFAFAIGSTLTTGLSAGAAVVLARGRPTPEHVAQVLATTRPTVLSSVPTLYARLLRAEVDPDALVSLRACVSAGEPLPAAVSEGLRRRFGITPLEHLGSTEYLHPFAATRPGDLVPGTVGSVMPGIDALVLDGDRQVGPGKPGDLWVRGPAVMDGYLHRREATRRALAGGWLRTGDRVRFDERGRLTVLGRSDELLLVAGMKVAPAEIEAALLAHPGVQEAAVVAARDPDGLVQPWAFVVPAPGAPTDSLAAELLDVAAARLPGYGRPRVVRLVTELPRTPTGKVQRFRLADQATRELTG